MKGDLKIISTEQYADIAIVRCEEPAQVTDVATGQVTQSYFRELFILLNSAQGWHIYSYMFSQNPSQAQ